MPKHVLAYGRQDEPVRWDRMSVLHWLLPYAERYPDLLTGIYWWGLR